MVLSEKVKTLGRYIVKPVLGLILIGTTLATIYFSENSRITPSNKVKTVYKSGQIYPTNHSFPRSSISDEEPLLLVYENNHKELILGDNVFAHRTLIDSDGDDEPNIYRIIGPSRHGVLSGDEKPTKDQKRQFKKQLEDLINTQKNQIR
ncbi:MAG: hypothetical protein ISS25_01240 [Nanoarchaeota archaeon]|nr:hypothetical protein [DPANN group archaeon]MBL7116439.1 hypothetical protein [Nanoarchaeota archaeon]